MTRPAISVIIPTHRRPRHIEQCVAALVSQTLPHTGFEVIVVDDASPDPVEPLLRGALDRAKLDHGPALQLHVLRQSRAGPAAARNAGAAMARGDWLAFTDDDCRPGPRWLETLLKAGCETPEAMLGGQTINGLPANLCSSASQDLIDYLYDYYTAKSGSPAFFTSNNLALRREHFLALDGFSRKFTLAAGEDREICERWREAGGTLRFLPEATVTHMHALSLRRFWRQHANYGQGARDLHRILAERGRSGLPLEPARFYWGLLTHKLGREQALRGAVLAGLTGVSQLAMVAGYLRALRRP